MIYTTELGSKWDRPEAMHPRSDVVMIWKVTKR